MFCPNCGYENPDDSLFCEKCGTNLAEDDFVETPSASQNKSPQIQARDYKEKVHPIDSTKVSAFDNSKEKKTKVILIAVIICIAFFVMTSFLRYGFIFIINIRNIVLIALIIVAIIFAVKKLKK